MSARTTTPGLYWKAHWASTMVPAESESGACQVCGDQWAEDELCDECRRVVARCFECKTPVANPEVDIFGTAYCGRCA